MAGLDLGLVKDRTAGDHPPGSEDAILDDLMVFQGSRDEPVSIAAVERAFLDARRRFPGMRLVADPWQLKASVERFRQAGLRVTETNFSTTTIGRLSTTLYQAISDGLLRVYSRPGP